MEMIITSFTVFKLLIGRQLQDAIASEKHVDLIVLLTRLVDHRHEHGFKKPYEDIPDSLREALDQIFKMRMELGSSEKSSSKDLFRQTVLSAPVILIAMFLYCNDPAFYSNRIYPLKNYEELIQYTGTPAARHYLEKYWASLRKEEGRFVIGRAREKRTYKSDIHLFDLEDMPIEHYLNELAQKDHLPKLKEVFPKIKNESTAKYILGAAIQSQNIEAVNFLLEEDVKIPEKYDLTTVAVLKRGLYKEYRY